MGSNGMSNGSAATLDLAALAPVGGPTTHVPTTSVPTTATEPAVPATPSSGGQGAGATSTTKYQEPAGPYRSVLLHLLWMVLGVVVLGADVVSAKTAFDAVFNVSGASSLGLAGAVTLAAVVSSFETGKALRARRVAGTGSRTWLFYGAAWAALGLAMFALRLFQGWYTFDPTATWQHEAPVAVLVAILYLAAGATVMTQAFELHNPKLAAYVRADRQVRALTRDLRTVKARKAAMLELLETWDQKVLGRLADSLQVRLNQVAAIAALLADRMRVVLATHLGNPPLTTPVIETPHRTGGPTAE